MQSRLTATAVKLNRVLFSSAGRHHEKQILAQRYGFATSTGRTADPALYSVDPEEVGADEAMQDEKRRHSTDNESTTTKDNISYVRPKSPLKSSPQLENHGVGPQTNPLGQQKRRKSTNAAAPMEDVACDINPWPANDRETNRREQREEQREDDREYFKHHKASPLSEIKVADTRKPVSQVTDGTAQNDAFGYDAGGLILFRPEQLDTAEEALRRASEIFRENAVRGDPDSPHGRVLRQLRGENW